MVGACGSGANVDCRQGSQELTHELRCVEKPTQNLASHAEYSPKNYTKKDWGQWAFCGTNQVAVACCSGGETWCDWCVNQDGRKQINFLKGTLVEVLSMLSTRDHP